MPLPSFRRGLWLGPVLWEQPLPQPDATVWNFSAQEAQRTQLALLVLEDLAFLDFKDIYSEMFKAALKAGTSNSHSPNPPKGIENSDLKLSQNNTISSELSG